MKRAAFFTFMLLAAGLWWFHDAGWDVVATTASVPSPLGDGLDCSEYVHRNNVKQVICYRSEDRWWGTATLPAYYTQDNGPIVPLF